MIQRIAVTGASGYIGQALINELLVRNLEPYAISRAPLQENFSGIPFLRVKDYAKIPAMQDTILVHLAETSLISDVEQQGENYIAKTSDQTAALLTKNWKRVVYASSGQVYGNKTSVPHAPDDAVVRDCVYSRAKLRSEKLVLDAGGVVARIGNVYGHPVKPKTVFADILDQLSETSPLKVRDENPARDYLWVEDVAKGLADIALGVAVGIYNLGSNIAVSAGDIARTTLAINGSRDREVVSLAPKENIAIDTIALDTTATTRDFGWQPITSLNEGLTKLMRGIK
jgi:nucleoside-diphosphate-sugar epimerase